MLSWMPVLPLHWSPVFHHQFRSSVFDQSQLCTISIGLFRPTWLAGSVHFLLGVRVLYLAL